jgi:cell division protein ZapA (FtsZ GTPase activity inhibitor)
MASTAKVAILTALNIADELFQKEQQSREQEESHSEMISRLAERIESALDDSSSEQAAEDAGGELSPGVESLQESSTPGKTFTG